MEGQDSFIMRQPEDVEAEFGEDDEDVVADAGNNADLYAANQASTELINEVPTEEAPLRFMDQDVFHHQPLSLDSTRLEPIGDCGAVLNPYDA